MWVFVEDTHGVDFHRTIVSKLRNSGLLGFTPSIRKLPSRLCNPGLLSKLVSIADSEGKIVIVVDDDGNPALARSRVQRHLEGWRG